GSCSRRKRDQPRDSWLVHSEERVGVSRGYPTKSAARDTNDRRRWRAERVELPELSHVRLLIEPIEAIVAPRSRQRRITLVSGGRLGQLNNLPQDGARLVHPYEVQVLPEFTYGL